MFSTVILVTLVALINPSYSYMITVDAHAEECFMEKVTSGTKLGKLTLFLAGKKRVIFD